MDSSFLLRPELWILLLFYCFLSIQLAWKFPLGQDPGLIHLCSLLSLSSHVAYHRSYILEAYNKCLLKCICVDDRCIQFYFCLMPEKVASMSQWFKNFCFDLNIFELFCTKLVKAAVSFRMLLIASKELPTKCIFKRLDEII